MAVIDFIFILLGKKYIVRASDFWAATGYMNGVREGLFQAAIWVPNGEPNTFVLGKNDSE
jgi:hypothetical protein